MDNVIYCKFKDPCMFKEIIRSKHQRRKGIYYVICRNPEGCNQKTFYPIKIYIPVSPLNTLGKFAILKKKER